MIWRIIGIICSITFISTAFSIWGDPFCPTVSIGASRHLFVVSCSLDPYSGLQSGPVAFISFVIGLALLIWNAWPALKWISRSLNSAPAPLAPAVPSQVFACYCNKCGNGMAEADIFCGKCGAEKRETMEPKCLSCNTPMVTGGKFCVQCGSSYRAD